MKNVTLFILALIFALQLHAAVPGIIYYNGKIVTMDKAGTVVSAVAVADGKILALGSDQAMKKLAGPATKMIDLEGKTVTPGLIDAHTHPVETLYLTTAWVDCRYPEVTSVKQALNNISDRVKITKKGEWIFAACVSASQNKFLEKRMPTKAELDSVCPDNPLAVADGAHLCIVNSPALRTLGVTKGMKALPKGGNVILDKDGNPTGALGDAESDIPANPTVEQLVSYFTTGIQQFWNSYGYTSVLALTPAQAMPVMLKIASEGVKPTLRYTVAIWTAPNGIGIPGDLSMYRFSNKVNPDYYRFNGIKAWVDGENDARTGLMYQPYLGHYDTDPPGNCGTQIASDSTIATMIAVAKNNHVMGMFHCAGDKATDICLDAYEKMMKQEKPTSLFRIEHFGVFELTPKQISRARSLYASGLRIAVQPVWLTALVKADIENMGPERANTGFEFRSMVDAGLEPAASTDMTGMYLANTDPMKAIAAMVTRISDNGLFHPEQALTVKEALQMWTIWAAKSMGEENLKGSIEPGKFADMTVLSEDIFTIAPDRIKNVYTVQTIVGGEVVFTSTRVPTVK